MPAAESMCHSLNYPQAFTLHDGRTVELRCGCIVDSINRTVLTNSRESPAYILAHARLTAEQREHWQEFGPGICEGAGYAKMSLEQALKMKA